jgi:hypothetical protein
VGRRSRDGNLTYWNHIAFDNTSSLAANAAELSASWTYYIWTILLSAFKIDVTIELVPFLNLAFFVLATSISSAMYKKTYIEEKTFYYYDLFKGQISKGVKITDNSTDIEYIFCFLFNVFICVVVFRQLLWEMTSCFFISCRPGSYILMFFVMAACFMYVPLVGFLFSPNIKIYFRRLMRATAIVIVFVLANYISLYAKEVAALLGE